MFIILIIFIILIHKHRKYKTIFPSKANVKECIENYLNTLSSSQLQKKVGKKLQDKVSLKELYYKSLQNLDNKEKKKLYKISKKLKLENVKFVKTENIEFNFPFTLCNIIFLPSWKFTNKVSTESLESTIMHEYTHILQRRDQKKYDKIYVQKFGKFIFQIKRENVNFDSISNNMIINPDADPDNVWLIKQGNELYYVPYMLSKNGVDTDLAFRVEKIDDDGSVDNHLYKILSDYIPLSDLDYSKEFDESVLLTDPNETYVNYLGY
jgi:hypothetical protein